MFGLLYPSNCLDFMKLMANKHKNQSMCHKGHSEHYDNQRNMDRRENLVSFIPKKHFLVHAFIRE